MQSGLRTRAACLAPLLIASPLAVAGVIDPLALPLIGGLGLGFALRPVETKELALCLAGAAALAAPLAPLQLLGAGVVLLIGASNGRRAAAAVALLGGAAVAAGLALDPDGPATVLVQLRLLALVGGGGLLAVLALGAVPAAHGDPIARRAAGVAAVIGLWCLCRHAAAGWPDGWRLASPYLLWAAPALAVLAVAGGARGRLMVAAGPAAAALLGALSGTALGLHGAAWALAGAAVAVGFADVEGRLDRWTAALVGGLPVGLPGVAAGVALWAAATAVHPAPLRVAALVTAGLMVVGALSASRGGTTGGRTALAAVLLISGPVWFLVHPVSTGAERAAAAIDGRRLPIDDMRGWRRLSRLAAPAPSGPPDAGPPATATP